MSLPPPASSRLRSAFASFIVVCFTIGFIAPPAVISAHGLPDVKLLTEKSSSVKSSNAKPVEVKVPGVNTAIIKTRMPAAKSKSMMAQNENQDSSVATSAQAFLAKADSTLKMIYQSAQELSQAVAKRNLKLRRGANAEAEAEAVAQSLKRTEELSAFTNIAVTDEATVRVKLTVELTAGDEAAELIANGFAVSSRIGSIATVSTLR